MKVGEHPSPSQRAERQDDFFDRWWEDWASHLRDLAAEEKDEIADASKAVSRSKGRGRGSSSTTRKTER
jgi:hypothetical protein